MTEHPAHRGRVRLVSNWKRVLTHAWSSWCLYLVLVLQVAQQAVSFAEIIPMKIIVPGVLVVALVLRVFKQESVSGSAD